jgi:hypothetical protein
MTNVTVVISLANGKTIVGANMWETEQPVTEFEDGSFEGGWSRGRLRRIN